MRASLRPQRSTLAWLCGLLLLLAASAALVTPASASAGSTRARAYGESTIDIQVEQSPAEKAWLAKTHHTQEEKEGEKEEENRGEGERRARSRRRRDAGEMSNSARSRVSLFVVSS